VANLNRFLGATAMQARVLARIKPSVKHVNYDKKKKKLLPIFLHHKKEQSF